MISAAATFELLPPRGKIDYRTDVMRALLQNPLQYPSWAPSATVWGAEDVSRITNLRIPKTSEQGARQGGPDLVLYGLGHLEDLDPSFDDRVNQFVSGNHHLLLVNASGSGKTRLVLETLYRHWGFYFGADIDYTVNPYGSEDFPDLVSDLSNLAHVPLSPRAERLSLLERNQLLVDTHMRRVILARLLILDHYVTLAAQCGVDDAEARAKWLWLQLRPTELVGCDIFRNAHAQLYSWSQESIGTRLGELLDKHLRRLEFVALDEAQILVAKSTTSFIASDRLLHQPLLHALISYLASTFTLSRCIATGTKVPLSVMEDALSSSGHPVKAVYPFAALGGFDDLPRSSLYLRYFLGSDLSDEDCALAHCWLRGRHRMMSVLVDRTLRFGLRRYRTLLDSIVYTTAGFDPHARGTGTLLNVNLLPVTRDETLEESGPLAPALRSAAYIYLTQGTPARFTSDCGALVGIGLARFSDDSTSATVDEPIMLLNLARWLQASRHFSTASIIRRRIRDPSTTLRGVALAEAVAFSLWQSFGVSGLKATQIAAFPGVTPPWASRRGAFCLTSVSSGTRTFSKYRGSAPRLVQLAQDVNGVISWLSDSTAPFLIPDPALGAQLLFVLSAPPSHRLVIVHIDPFTRDRPHRYNSIAPRKPTELYPTDQASRAKFVRAVLSFTRPIRSSLRSKQPPSSPSTLQIYCFVDLQRSEHTYDPPVATMRLRYLVEKEDIVEMSPAHMSDYLRSVR
ncbi:hypothetical protein AURDEDRAFT_186223 [Auricularia subglabra TFB-10046 SS5]|nr:hypothetical protein AURDEDRAFT_186223 [Auricularia subglabra TFB-10046 SS5]